MTLTLARTRTRTVDAPTPEKLRLRLAAWSRYVFVQTRAVSVASMAKDMGVSQTGLNRIIGGTATPGIDFAVRLAVFGSAPLDTLFFRDPPEQFFTPGIPRLPLAQPRRRPR